MNLGPSLTTYTKINSKRIRNLNKEAKTLKLRAKNIIETYSWHCGKQGFLYNGCAKLPTLPTKRHILDFIKNKTMRELGLAA